MAYRSILLLGEPGCGKSTVGRALGALPEFVHFSTGDMFRSIDRESKLGRRIASHTEKGELVPNEPTIKLWRHFVEKKIQEEAYRPDQDTLILDGIPGNVEQARKLKDDIELVKLVHFMVDDEYALLRRMMSRGVREGRPDDAKLEVMRKRREIYLQETVPVIRFFSASLAVEVNAMQSAILVLRDAIAALEGVCYPSAEK